MIKTNINHNRVEAVTMVFNLKEKQTSKGWMYTFTFALTGETQSGQELSGYLPTLIFTRERVAIKDRQIAHFSGELKIKPAYGDYPQTVQVVGYFLEPVFGNVYRIAKSKRTTTTQEETEDSIREGEGVAVDDEIPF